MIQNLNLIKLLVKYGADVNLKVGPQPLRSIMTLAKKRRCTTA